MFPLFLVLSTQCSTVSAVPLSEGLRRNSPRIFVGFRRYDAHRYKQGRTTNTEVQTLMRHRGTDSDSPQLWGSDDSTWERARARRDRRIPAPQPAPDGDSQHAGDLAPDGQVVLLYSIVQAAKALGVGRSTIYQLIGSGDLEVIHIGRAARIPVEAVQDFVRRLRAS